MTDKERFASFFEEMDVAFGEHPRQGWNVFDDPAPSDWEYVIGVGQAFFVFDEDERYLGVVQDVPFAYYPRGSRQPK